MLVEDDHAVAQTLTDALESSGYRVWLAETGADAKTLLEQTRPDLIILDLMLPDVDGLVLCSGLKAIADVPIVICSATPQKRDAILGLKLGADDFIAKPFDIYELEARVEAVLRRTSQTRVSSEASPSPPDHIRVGELIIDRSRRRVTLGGEPIQLTPTEYRLVSALASRPDEILSRDDLATLVWGYQDASSGRTIDVHIRRLRVKLSQGPVPAPAIVAVRGFGYKMAVEDTANGAAA
ncbi:MAG: response regulator transcription factor [Chloroflexi bacterium]|nr:response regulator transcription factor [Chloroflexota bacterium]MBV9135223.1 response regulator transcription factor [Chloroflexota bacterium]MBV9894564.1 response regulator transcription factor [Chloroflexota bacterium]